MRSVAEVDAILLYLHSFELVYPLCARAYCNDQQCSNTVY